MHDDILSRVTTGEAPRQPTYVVLGVGVALLLVAAGLSLRWRRRLRVGAA